MITPINILLTNVASDTSPKYIIMRGKVIINTQSVLIKTIRSFLNNRKISDLIPLFIASSLSHLILFTIIDALITPNVDKNESCKPRSSIEAGFIRTIRETDAKSAVKASLLFPNTSDKYISHSISIERQADIANPVNAT